MDYALAYNLNRMARLGVGGLGGPEAESPDIIAALYTDNSWLGSYTDASRSGTLFQGTDETTPAGSGDTVGYRKDLSGNGNHITQATEAQRALAGIDTVNYDGVDDSHQGAFSATANSAFLIAVVRQDVSETAVAATLGQGGSEKLQLYATSGNLAGVVTTSDGSTGRTSTVAASAKSVLTLFWDGGIFSVYVNGSLINTPTSRGGTMTITAGLTVGMLDGGSFHWDGAVPAVAAGYNTGATLTQIQTIENEFASRHGITF